MIRFQSLLQKCFHCSRRDCPAGSHYFLSQHQLNFRKVSLLSFLTSEIHTLMGYIWPDGPNPLPALPGPACEVTCTFAEKVSWSPEETFDSSASAETNFWKRSQTDQHPLFCKLWTIPFGKFPAVNMATSRCSKEVLVSSSLPSFSSFSWGISIHFQSRWNKSSLCDSRPPPRFL